MTQVTQQTATGPIPNVAKVADTANPAVALTEASFNSASLTAEIPPVKRSDADIVQGPLPVERQRESAELQGFIRQLSGSGYNVEVANMRVSLRAPAGYEKLDPLLDSLSDRWLSFSPDSPLRNAQNVAGDFPYIDKTLTRVADVSFGISPYALELKSAGQKYGLTLYNLLDQQQPVLLTRSFSAEELQSPDKMTVFSAEIKQVLDASLPRADAVMREIVDSKSEQQPKVSLDRSRQLDEKTALAARKIYNYTSRRDAGVELQGENADRYFSFSSASGLKLDLAVALYQAQHPVTIDGGINTLSLRRTASTADLQFDKIIDKAPLVLGDTTGTEGRRELLTKSIDRFGNHILTAFSVEPSGETQINTEVYFPCPPAVKKGSAEFRPVSLDLSSSGYGSLNGFFEVRPEKEIGRFGHYQFTSQLPQKVLADKQADFPELCNGVRQAEALFGFKSGGLIDRVRIIPAEESNANFNAVNPRAVSMQLPILNESRSAIGYIGRHETFHAIDEYFTVIDGKTPRSLSAGKFAEQFDKISNSNSDYFLFINESAFIGAELAGHGSGHSQDNPNELFATLMNSLLAPGWEEKMRAAEPRFQQVTLDLIKALRSNCEEAGVKRRAPIHPLLNRRESFLNLLGGAETTEPLPLN